MADSEDFSVFVLASDLGVDARPFLSHEDSSSVIAQDQEENWHDCSSYFDQDFSDLELLQFIQLRGFDKHGNRILQIVGKYFPAQVISADRLKKYVFFKIYTEVAEGPYCILYMHTTVQREDKFSWDDHLAMDL